MSLKPSPDLILYNGRITTLDPAHPEASNVVMRMAGLSEWTTPKNTNAVQTPRRLRTLRIRRGGEIQRDGKGHPTGLLIARPNATILA